MKGIILCAGRGRRLGHFGGERPKCLLNAGGQTLLYWQRRAFEGCGISDLALVSGYQSEQLPKQPWTCFHNERWAETGVVASLLTARTWLEASICLVSYSDIVYGPRVVAALRDATADISVPSYSRWRLLWEARFADPLIDAESFLVDPSGRLLEIGRRATNLADIQGQFMGLVKFTPQGFARVLQYIEQHRPAIDRIDMTCLLQGLIEAGAVIQSLPVDDFWFEFDTVTDAMLYPTWAAKYSWPSERLDG
jgi:choline kinase